MSADRRRRVLVTQRTLSDLAQIERFSIENWGEAVAARYISAFDAALARLKANPELATTVPGLHAALRLYRVNKHMLVCDLQDDALYVLTVIHTSRDIPSRLAELEPTLSHEVNALRKELASAGQQDDRNA